MFPSHVGVYDSQPEHLLKTIEVLVTVQQLVAGLQTESSDQAIHRPADGVTLLTQLPIVLRGANGEIDPTSRENMKLREIRTYAPELALTPNTLQNLAQDQVREAQSLPFQLVVQPPCFRTLGAAQVIDPHGSVDDDHSCIMLESARDVTR